MPPGGLTEAVLASEPVAPAAIVPLAEKVTLPPTSTFTALLMLPLPLAGQLDPGDALHVHVTPLSMPAKVSVTVAPVTSLGPALVTVMV
jgi:hypothetical protein